jgi:hypothetical protein
MGIVLHYKSSLPVDESVRLKIIDEAAALENQRDWWTEPMYFHANPRSPGELVGRTKINPPDEFTLRGGEIIAVYWTDGWFMVYADVRFIVSRLCDWSLQHGLRWIISCDGEPAGRIERGSADKVLSKFLRSVAKEGAASLDEAADEKRYEDIVRRYRDAFH